MKDVLLATAACLGLMLVVVVLIVGIAYPIASAGCHYRWEGVREAEYGLFSGCRVESNGKMVPEDRVWYERNQ